jgi:hypothetical protein
LSRRLLGVLLASVALGALPACGSSGTSAFGGASLPAFRAGCGVAKGLPSIPLYLSRSGAAVTPFVSVCLEGKGPYPFVLGTGASRSLIARSLAEELKLPTAAGGGAAAAPGAGCAGPGTVVVVGQWSVGAMSLASQTLVETDAAGFGTGGAPAGILGGDVLSRFGAIRVDYALKRLSVLAPESTAPAAASIRRADHLQPAPPLLVRSTTASGALLTVLRSTDGALASGATSFGTGGPQSFLVDTGAGRTTVSPAATQSASLSSAGSSSTSSVVGCPGTAIGVHSGPWTFGSVDQRPQVMASGVVSDGGAGAAAGVVGSDTLSRYSSVVLDYRTAILWLGAG